MRVPSQNFALSVLCLCLTVAGSVAWNASSATMFVSSYSSSLQAANELDLSRVIASAGHARSIGRSLAEAPQFSKYDRNLVRLYTSSAYEYVNNMAEQLVDELPGLRGPLLGEERELDYKLYVQLQKSLAKLPVYKDPVYRGSLSSKGTDPAARYFTGRVWRERRFSSATKSRSIAESLPRARTSPSSAIFCPRIARSIRAKRPSSRLRH